MSKYNAKVISNYITNQKNKMKSREETARAAGAGLAALSATCAGVGLPYVFMPDAANQNFATTMFVMSAVSGGCALASYLVEKHRRNKYKDLSHLSELTEEVVNDYNCIEATINTAKRGCSNEDILESLSPLFESEDELENQMVLEKF